MSSFFLPLSRDVMMELVVDPETEELKHIVIFGFKLDVHWIFYPLASFLQEMVDIQIEMIADGEASDVTKLNWKEFMNHKRRPLR